MFDMTQPEKAIFKAKNVAHNEIQLRVPVFVNDLAFVPNSADCVFAVATAYGQLRTYDSRIKGKPVHKYGV